jgi:hypothetical protein
MRNAYKILVRKSEEKRPFGISGSRWEYNIRMKEFMDWVYLVQDRAQW